MEAAQFKAQLEREGYQEISTAEMRPSETRPAHAHDFDVAALVLDGEITLTCGDVTKTYRTGDSFTMEAGLPHAEAVGPDGFRYMVGRRRRS